jgi:calcium-dependent protein kinase
VLRAVKIINKKYIAEEDKLKLIKEIDILKQLDHPNIIKLYEFF